MGFKNFVGIRLRNGETNHGILFLDIEEINIPLLQGICAQISIALANIMANEQISQKQEEQAFLLDFSHDIAQFLSNVKFQPIAAEDVASFVAQAAQSAPINGTTEIAGPDRFALYEIVTKYLQQINDHRQVVQISDAKYYGGHIDDTTLVPAGQGSWARSILKNG